MPVLTNQVLPQNANRTYHVHVPANPSQSAVPTIIVFHGGGQEVSTIAKHWGLQPGNPIPANVENYLLVFPSSDERLFGQWIHHKQSDSGFPTFDLEFVQLLLDEITTTAYATGSVTVPTVSADPGLIYVAGFSNGGGMVWQLVNSDLVTLFRGFAAVGLAMHPEKAQQYRQQLGPGNQPPAVPLMYIHGTGEHTFRPPATLQEVPIETTQPAFTVLEMLDRNGISPAVPAATTTLEPGTTNLTEVVTQTFLGTEAFRVSTVLHGGHNWPTPTNFANQPVASHVDATQMILDFWHSEAGLP